jgi:hypothetical protein
MSELIHEYPLQVDVNRKQGRLGRHGRLDRYSYTSVRGLKLLVYAALSY